MGVLRGALTSKRRQWRKMNNNSQRKTHRRVLMSELFEGLPLLPDGTVRFELDQFRSDRACVIESVLITG